MPDWRGEINSRLAPLRFSPVREREIADELVDHLDERYRDLKSAGLGDADAERIARSELDSNEVLTRAFGQAERAAPAEPVVPGGGGGMIMGTIWQDVRYGARTLRRSPGVAVVAVLTLALGIGANSAMFELLSAVSLRPLPVADPHSLAEIRIADRRNATGSFRGRRPNLTYTLWEHIRAEQQVFSGVFAWGNQMLNLTTGGEAKYAQALWVSGEYFSVLGVQPVLGRLITPADDQRGCQTPGVVISQAFWQQHFGGEPGVVGRTLPIEGRQFEVLGVTPRSFSGVEVGRGFDVALPLCAEVILGGERASLPKSDHWWLAAMGRLKPGVTPEAATSQLQSISSGIFATTQPLTYVPEDAATYRAFRFEAFPSPTGVSVLRGRYENPLWILLAMTGLVLVIACANLANLLLARASVRAREMAVRLALGASRQRLVRQLMIENLLLAGAGAVAGIAIAHIASQGLVALLDAGRSVILVDVRPDWRVLGFTTALGALTCLLFGLAPALRATRVAPGAVMKATGRSIAVNPARAGIGRVLVIVQVALSLVLVIGALLFVRTLRNLNGLDVGFSHSRVLTASIDMQSLNLDPDGIIGLRERVLERVKAVPGVESAALGDIVPLSGSGWNERVIAGSDTKMAGISNFNGVSPGFFAALGTPMRAGRDFAPTDTRTSPKVAIVNETFVREILGGAEPLGQTFRIEVGPGQPVQTYEIVGLVRDSKYRNLREAFSPIAFVSLGQVVDPGPFVTVFTRSSVPPASLIAPATRVLAEVHPRLIVDFDPLSDTVRMGLVLERLMATLAGFFGALAGLLAVIGLYGVLSYMVARRRAEIGIRMALGANRRSVIGLIVREAAVLLVIGLVGGAALALVATKRTSSLLFGLQPSDPFTLALGVTVLAIVALAASYWPARRASRLDPLVVLRDE